MKKMKYKKGGALKPVPKDNKGLAKLPTSVRNKMGYMMAGGEKLLLKSMKSGGSLDMISMMMKGGEKMKKYKYGGKMKKY